MAVRIQIDETVNPGAMPGGSSIEWPDGGVASYRDARAGLLALGVEFKFDRRQNKPQYRRPSFKKWRDLDDKELSSLRQAFAAEFGFDARKDHLFDASMQLAYEHCVDPVQQYLKGLKWDDEKRVGTWLAVYLGVEDTPLTRAIGVIILVAAVKRALHPGCRFDAIPVLIGPQGAGKTRAVRSLAIKAEWHSQQELLHLSGREQKEALQGVWIYELCELGGLHRSSVERVKAFTSMTRDRARDAYARFRSELPRCCIFIATTNEDRFLRDQTGNRRFWPLKVGKINLKKLKADIDQLWAEAVSLEAAGESIVLPSKLWPAAAAEQAKRMEDDPWVDMLADLVGVEHDGMRRISFAEVIERLRLPPHSQTRDVAKRIVDCMKQNGWERADKPFKHRGRTVRGFVKSAVSSEPTAKPAKPKRKVAKAKPAKKVSAKKPMKVRKAA
jgi:predicted P-loop ATPase